MNSSTKKRQEGAAVMVLLLIFGVLGAYFAVSALNRASQSEEAQYANALVQAKEAVIGYAATYRDTHADQVFGYLPCPNTNNTSNGNADTFGAACGAATVGRVGRLPWRTLGLPALRDRDGECLWYAVSRTAKDSPLAVPLNWDTVGQYIVQDAAGSLRAGVSPHDQPLAVILAPRRAVNQTRGLAVTAPNECGGSNTAMAAYLEGVGALNVVPTTIVTSTADSILSRTNNNNDQALWVTNKDIFDRVKRRSDFKNDINTMVGDLANCLNFSGVTIPAAVANSKGVPRNLGFNVPSVPGNDAVCEVTPATPANVLANWRNNLLYTRPSTSAIVNGNPGCKAVLFFGGERTAAQSRATAPAQGDATNYGDPTMYLEGTNAPLFPLVPNAAFPSGSTYTGGTAYDSTLASSDIARCIKGPADGGQASMKFNFNDFTPTGNLLSDDFGLKTFDSGVTTNANNQSIHFGAKSPQGGCFWYTKKITPLAGLTLRAHYNYEFDQSDDPALPGRTDRGNGFSFQIVSGLGLPPTTTTCGLTNNMGVLTGSPLTEALGIPSLFVETDVHLEVPNILIGDPPENHSAIMVDGDLSHTSPKNRAPFFLTPSNVTTACDGSAAGCAHTPAYKFEESAITVPVHPLTHSQRIEIQTGCNADCSSCNPANIPEQITKVNDRDFIAPVSWIQVPTLPPLPLRWTLLPTGEYQHSRGIGAATLPNTALTNDPKADTLYQIVLTIKTTRAGKLTIAYGGAPPVVLDLALVPPVLTNYTANFIATSDAPLTLTPDANWAGTIDNVRIKAVPQPTFALITTWVDCGNCNDTVVSLQDGAGPELIFTATDRDFGSGLGNWTGTLGVNELSFPVAPASPATLSSAGLSRLPVVGPAGNRNSYQMEFTLKTTDTGTLTVRFGGQQAPITQATGAHTKITFRLEATLPETVTFTPDATWTGTIDNVSIKPIEQIIAAADRRPNASGNWKGVGTDWLFTGGGLTRTAGGVTNALTLPEKQDVPPVLFLNSPPVAGTSYEVRATVSTSPTSSIGAKLVIGFGGDTSAPIVQVPGTTRTYPFHLTARSPAPLTLIPDSNWEGSVDNISVKLSPQPTMTQCVKLDPKLNSIYYGFTGGFLSGNADQGVTLKNLFLRSE